MSHPAGHNIDPTFYRSPADAISAPPEKLAYVAAFDRGGQRPDALAVIDTDPDSADYGQITGWNDLPTSGNELHHFGWNACSSAFAHAGRTLLENGPDGIFLSCLGAGTTGQAGSPCSTTTPSTCCGPGKPTEGTSTWPTTPGGT
jgi:hypothetical protein